MLIGLTYDLRSEYLSMGFGDEETAEFDRESTIEAIERELTALGHSTVRIGNTFSLVNHLSAGKTWDMVFNISEGLLGYGRESVIPCILESYAIPYTFSDPLTLSVALHKPTTKRLVSDMGIQTPRFTVVNGREDISSVNLPFPLFAKPVAEGTSKGISGGSLIRSCRELEQKCISLLDDFHQPVLIETYLSGREFTVGIIGTGAKARTAGVMEVTLKNTATHDMIYSYQGKENCEVLTEYRLASGKDADSAAQLALAVWQGLSCRDAGRVDVRADENGIMNFIEVNPLAGLHPDHSDLPIMWSLSGKPYNLLIKEILESASYRLDENASIRKKIRAAINKIPVIA